MHPVDRFLRLVAIAGPDDCWPWLGAVNEQGYGRFYGYYGRMTKAHRFAYEMWVGLIPDGLDVLHRCDNPPCCNPAHVFLGTDTDNAHDRDRKGRHRTNGNERKTYCPAGHPYSGGNLYTGPDGKRRCRECAQIARRHYRSTSARSIASTVKPAPSMPSSRAST